MVRVPFSTFNKTIKSKNGFDCLIACYKSGMQDGVVRLAYRFHNPEVVGSNPTFANL